jgi:NAD(P)-dependent dehydrogenase (short-subunit alcohol dehydrogenase family)
MNLKGKVIMITGAAQGFGRAIALDCARDQATIVACDLDNCDETVKLVEAKGAKALGISFDITDAAACVTAAEKAVKAFGHIDGLVNNGALYGALHFAPFEYIDPDEWDLVMKVNVKGTWNMCKAVAPHMRKAGKGSIVNVSSNSALFGPAMMCHYVTSKAAVIGLSRNLASELGPSNIRVNSVCPGGMNTPGSIKVAGDNLQAMLDASPKARIKAFMEPEEVTGTIKFLVSDDSTVMTGQILTSDGGMTTL